ncbi:glycine betaine ABC transporter substrate-binding protein [Paenibacillus thiaminolyticus]|uniref:glycine betaine ABC transporter substrate-binding protein n=1 Tax=Paenibacillus thiaminolyticus TaxID=49283 RepID=UPI003D2DD528
MDAYSTDSELRQHDLVVLEDDKHLFPHSGRAAYAQRQRYSEAVRPERIEALNRLAGCIPDDEVREMNYQVNAEGRSERQGCREAILTKAGCYKAGWIYLYFEI